RAQESMQTHHRVSPAAERPAGPATDARRTQRAVLWGTVALLALVVLLTSLMSQQWDASGGAWGAAHATVVRSAGLCPGGAFDMGLDRGPGRALPGRTALPTQEVRGIPALPRTPEGHLWHIRGPGAHPGVPDRARRLALFEWMATARYRAGPATGNSLHPSCPVTCTGSPTGKTGRRR